MTILRFRISALLCNHTYLAEIRQIAFDIKSEYFTVNSIAGGVTFLQHRLRARYAYTIRISSPDSPVLCKLRVDPWKVRLPIGAALAITSFICITNILSGLQVRPEGWKTPLFYVAILELQISFSVYSHIACYVLVIGFHVVLPLLRMGNRELEQAVKATDVSRLEVSTQD